jgi:hypothetical protein
MEFRLKSDYRPMGDQPTAIAALDASLRAGNGRQTLLGVTGSGKTFTMANLIAQQQRPALIISHNKTLAAQLYSEFKNFFPENAVEYFVSYYDYYQPEAYVPSTDTFIEKDSAINEDIERLRISASSALLSRRDVVVIASVSWRRLAMNGRFSILQSGLPAQSLFLFMKPPVLSRFSGFLPTPAQLHLLSKLRSCVNSHRLFCHRIASRSGRLPTMQSFNLLKLERIFPMRMLKLAEILLLPIHWQHLSIHLEQLASQRA